MLLALVDRWSRAERRASVRMATSRPRSSSKPATQRHAANRPNRIALPVDSYRVAMAPIPRPARRAPARRRAPDHVASKATRVLPLSARQSTNSRQKSARTRRARSSMAIDTAQGAWRSSPVVRTTSSKSNVPSRSRRTCSESTQVNSRNTDKTAKWYIGDVTQIGEVHVERVRGEAQKSGYLLLDEMIEELRDEKPEAQHAEERLKYVANFANNQQCLASCAHLQRPGQGRSTAATKLCDQNEAARSHHHHQQYLRWTQINRRRFVTFFRMLFKTTVAT